MPGLGFDEVHLAAVCGPGTANGGFNGFGSPFFFPFFDSGYSIPNGPSDSVAPEAEQPENSDELNAESRRRARDWQPTPPVETSNAPVPEIEQYVFVRRDGTVFFAVAYAWENGILRYVTSEGLRRNIDANALDLAATQEFNEQRGVNFRLPA